MNRNGKLVLVFVILALVQMACASTGTMPVNYAPPVSDAIIFVRGSSVAYGIQQALLGASGTTILQQGDKYIFTWSYADMKTVGFFAIDTTGKTILDITKTIKAGAQMTSGTNVSSVIEYLKMNGWQTVTPSTMATAAFWNIAAATCEAAARLPMLILFVGDSNADDFLNWYENLNPVIKT